MNMHSHKIIHTFSWLPTNNHNVDEANIAKWTQKSSENTSSRPKKKKSVNCEYKRKPIQFFWLLFVLFTIHGYHNYPDAIIYIIKPYLQRH